MTPPEIMDWILILFSAPLLVAMFIALNIILWASIRDLWRGL